MFLQADFALLAFPAAATFAFATFAETRLGLAIRENLTSWLQGLYKDADKV